MRHLVDRRVWAERIAAGKMYRVYRHRDFRLLWIGAFFSFMGSMVQSVAQGYIVYDITRDEGKLALVMFAAMAPVSVFGPAAGSLVDTLNKRVLLVVAQSVMAAGALFVAAAIHFAFLEYWHILAVAFVGGCAGALEMPTRQSIVSKVVPTEDLGAAIPLNALTFNLSRMLGPAIGGVILARYGAQTSYLINGISFFALVFTVLAIRADLRPTRREPQPIWDLLVEGFLYTFRERRLKTLFILEATVSTCALFYIAILPAIARDLYGLGRQGLGNMYSMVGIGSVIALLIVTNLSDRPVRGLLVKSSMTLIGVSLILLGFAPNATVAFAVVVLLGMGAVVQFNTTNTLFQLIAPDHLRGRVLSMHIWALAGLGPFGMLGFGYLAREIGIPVSLMIGGSLVLAMAAWGWIRREPLEVEPAPRAEG
jgi:MFS family permease